MHLVVMKYLVFVQWYWNFPLSICDCLVVVVDF
jgi:hypothetical protein